MAHINEEGGKLAFTRRRCNKSSEPRRPLIHHHWSPPLCSTTKSILKPHGPVRPLHVPNDSTTETAATIYISNAHHTLTPAHGGPEPTPHSLHRLVGISCGVIEIEYLLLLLLVFVVLLFH